MSQENNVSFYIKTAKTKSAKKGKTLEVAYKRVTQRANGKMSVSNASESINDLVHQDLLTSLKAFLPHFLLLGERANLNDFQPSYFKKKEYLKSNSPYEVTGIHIKESNEKQFVIMVGRQVLKSGRVISMVIPMVCFDPSEEDEDVYPLHKELKEAVDGYLSEVEQYVSGEKIGTPEQTEIDFEAKKEESSEEEVEEPEEQAGEGDALDQVIEDKKKVTKMKKVS